MTPANHNSRLTTPWTPPGADPARIGIPPALSAVEGSGAPRARDLSTRPASAVDRHACPSIFTADHSAETAATTPDDTRHRRSNQSVHLSNSIPGNSPNQSVHLSNKITRISRRITNITKINRYKNCRSEEDRHPERSIAKRRISPSAPPCNVCYIPRRLRKSLDTNGPNLSAPMPRDFRRKSNRISKTAKISRHVSHPSSMRNPACPERSRRESEHREPKDLSSTKMLLLCPHALRTVQGSGASRARNLPSPEAHEEAYRN